MENTRNAPLASLNNDEKQLDSFKIGVMNLIVKGEIDSFSGLMEYLSLKKFDPSKDFLNDAFSLLKKLYWGMFSIISREKFPRLWNSLILSNKRYPEFGDLKNYMLLSEIYVGILDIHGYTNFCQETKKNLSMLQRLDKYLCNDIVKCASSYGVVANRERGDEIVLVGAEASGILAATFEIIHLFSKKTAGKSLSGVNTDFYLPEFKISAGIAGGQPTIPLIITEKGSVSGFLINSAARLQTRANSISPKETKVIVEQYVLRNFQESPEKKTGFLEHLNFFQNGEISFKGVTLKAYEVFQHNAKETYKSMIESTFIKLQESIKENQWQSKVLTSLCELAIMTAKTIEPIDCKIIINKKNTRITNDFIVKEFADLRNQFVYNINFHEAIEKMGFICEFLSQVDNYDKLVLEYITNIYKMYKTAFEIYDGLYLKYVKENAGKLLSADEYKIFDYYHKIEVSYNKLIKHLDQTEATKDKRLMFWYNAVEATKNNTDFSIYSGKK